MAVNPLLLKTLEVAAGVAAQRSTGNGGVAAILNTLLIAYKCGKVGVLARHVLDWKANCTTGELSGVEWVPVPKPNLGEMAQMTQEIDDAFPPPGQKTRVLEQVGAMP